MPDQKPQSKVTLEDLLHLKRAERPTPEFWVGFERDLRQKQLAALVDSRPWWQIFPQLLSRRAYLPIGATAALAFTLVTVRYYTPEQSTAVAVPSEGRSVAATYHQPELTATNQAQSSNAEVAMPAQREESVRLDDRTAIAANASLSETLPEHTSGLTPWSAPHSVETTSSRSIAATIASLEQTQPELANAALGGRVPTGNHLEEAAIRTTELAGVAAATSKRSRLLAQFDERHFTPEPQAPEVLRERQTRRMASYQDLSDRFSRVDLQADRVLVKF